MTALTDHPTESSSAHSRLRERSPLIRNSRVEGTSQSINLGSGEVRVAHSQLIGGVSGSGTYSCIGAYDETMEGLDETCE